MKLTDRQKAMLDGERGEPCRVAMDMLCAIGEIYDADGLIPIRSAHCAGLSLRSHGVAGMEWAEDMARQGASVVVPTTMNVIGVDRSRDLGLPQDWTHYQVRIGQAYEAMGCIGTSSCTPYYFGFLPRYGEHIAWAESSAVVYTNSILGARDNREGGPSAWAAGITGFTPNYGFHLPENRRGDILFKVTTELAHIADYGALGNYVGSIVGEKIPVFEGLGDPSMEEMVYFGAAQASAGSVAMFHAIGITPEAPDLQTAFGGKRYETIWLGRAELEQGYANLISGKDRKVDYVALGCPHASINQLRQIADILRGQTVRDGVVLWIHTSVAIKGLARELGYLETIENAGGVVTQDLCTILSCPEALGFRTLATNSAKMAFYAPGSSKMDVWYGSLEQCLDAAVTGEWSGSEASGVAAGSAPFH